MENKHKNTFSGNYFLGFRDNSEYEKAKIAILPVSYEGTCTFGKGTKNAPKAILNSSVQLEPFDEEALFSLGNLGIHTLKSQNFSNKTNSKNVVEKTKEITKQILEDGKFPTIIGGEHSISIGSIQACAEKYSNLSVLQIDAHTDLDKSYKNEEYSHASMANKVLETTNTKITQVGIRSITPELINIASNTNTKIFFAHNIINKKHKISEILETLNKNVYLTIDVDAFDPSIFPNTGTPEPNGLKWQYIINLIKEISKKRNIVGFDLVEHSSTNPKKPHYSDFSAAKLIHKVLCIIWKEKVKQQSS